MTAVRALDRRTAAEMRRLEAGIEQSECMVYAKRVCQAAERIALCIEAERLTDALRLSQDLAVLSSRRLRQLTADDGRPAA